MNQLERQLASTHDNLVPVDTEARLRSIRARLPGQMLKERIETAQAWYGALYTLAEIRRNVAKTLPRHIGLMRDAVFEPIEKYREPIPDHALRKYDEADQSGLFSKFWVATPTYYEQRQVDPWIVGEIEGAKLCAVIAQWDV
ncbi:MAG: hypothetical protein HY727_18280 [Candidatus Rokubacteria bacterium]|nr:hypothetical protein [Candidatus Rokubacteria bacterium]